MNLSVVLHDIRSTHNVGAILRTCEGFGIRTVYIGGYTPYPILENDPRLPHISAKLTKAISKTSLGAEQTLDIKLYDSIDSLLHLHKARGSEILALEQSVNSIPLHKYKPSADSALLVIGREVEGIDHEILQHCDTILEIPMQGKKESFNVSVATGIALYALAS